MNEWLFRESAMEIYLRRRAAMETETYQGDPESIRVYLEKYIPKLEALHSRIQWVVRSLDHNNKDNALLWKCVETVPFEHEPCHIGQIEVIAVNCQNLPEEALAQYDNLPRKVEEELMKHVWPEVKRACEPYIEEAKTFVHPDCIVDIYEDKADNVYGVFLEFRPKELLNPHSCKDNAFAPGLESEVKNMNDWLFGDMEPAQEGLFGRKKEKNTDPDYLKGDPDSIRVYREKYVPKIHELYNQIETLINQAKGKFKGKYWNDMHFYPFKIEPNLVGLFSVVRIGLFDKPETEEDYDREGPSPTLTAFHKEVEPFIKAGLSKLSGPAKEIHCTIESGYNEDDCFLIDIVFKVPQMKQKGFGRYSYIFEPGLEAETGYWLFGSFNPDGPGLEPAEEGLFNREPFNESQAAASVAGSMIRSFGTNIKVSKVKKYITAEHSEAEIINNLVRDGEAVGFSFNFTDAPEPEKCWETVYKWVNYAMKYMSPRVPDGWKIVAMRDDLKGDVMAFAPGRAPKTAGAMESILSLARYAFRSKNQKLQRASGATKNDGPDGKTAALSREVEDAMRTANWKVVIGDLMHWFTEVEHIIYRTVDGGIRVGKLSPAGKKAMKEDGYMDYQSYGQWVAVKIRDGSSVPECIIFPITTNGTSAMVVTLSWADVCATWVDLRPNFGMFPKERRTCLEFAIKEYEKALKKQPDFKNSGVYRDGIDVDDLIEYNEVGIDSYDVRRFADEIMEIESPDNDLLLRLQDEIEKAAAEANLAIQRKYGKSVRIYDDWSKWEYVVCLEISKFGAGFESIGASFLFDD